MTYSAATTPANANLQDYQRLQLSLMLGLRRQISIAVCDNVQLRDRLARQLQQDFELPQHPQLVSIEIDLEHPLFLKQIGSWLTRYPHRSATNFPLTFQVLGIERLTREAPVQCRFLKHLQALSRHLPQLNVNLLLWLPRPWFYKIEQAVPEFWQWRTGVFQFQGEPEAIPTSLQSMVERLKYSLYETGTEVRENGTAVPAGDNGNGNGSLHRDFAIASQGKFPLIRNLKPVRSQPEPPPASENRSGQEEPIALPPRPQPLSLKELDAIAQLEGEEQSPEALAAALIELGDSYRDRIAAGESTPEILEAAIQAYEKALQWSEDDLPTAANILNDLGNFYWMRSRSPVELQQALADLEQAIQYYQLAAAQLGDAETSPQHYAMIQNNLGAAYGDLARYGEPADNLQLSIRAYEEALNYRSAEVDPLKYGSTQNNLGTAYWHLAQQQDPVANLQAAIAAYQEAIAQYSPETAAMQWAMIQNNLGTARWNLAQYESPEPRLREAILAYEQSLLYRTPEAAPSACATTQNNLGTAYWHLSSVEGLSSPEQEGALHGAVAAYEIAIALGEEFNQPDSPIALTFDLAATCNNLGLVRYQLATEEQFERDGDFKNEQLEGALRAHLQALQIATLGSETYQTTFDYLVKTIRAFYRQEGLAGQNRALSLVPGQLLPALLPKL